MGCKRIVACTVAFRPQLQITLCDLEIGLNVPAQHVRPHDFFFGQGSIRAYKTDPVLAVAVVSRIYELRRNGRPIAVCDHDIDGKQISGFAPSLFIAGIDFLYIQSAFLPGLSVCP